MATTLQSPLWAENHNLWTAESNDWDFGSSDADSYANVVYENVIESLQDIINKEFQIPVFDEHRGNQSFVIDPLEDTLIEHFASGQSRNYDVDIIYTLMRGGGWRSVKTQLTSTAEHLKRLIFNNSNYSPSGVYKFHDGKIETVEYNQDEDDLDLWRANISFNCIVTEVYA
jgi:hypothetical protein|tara:strand:- start:128 stop:640 length:513 start_codon:yes stop_codon:yes gene_type:complete